MFGNSTNAPPTPSERPDDLLTRADAARLLKVSKSTLETWAHTKRYPLKFIKIGKRCLYRRSDLEQFLAEAPVGGI